MLFIIIIIIYCMNLEVINQPACDVVDPYLQKTYCKARYAWRVDLRRYVKRTGNVILLNNVLYINVML